MDTFGYISENNKYAKKCLDFTKFKKGRGFFKFNNSLLTEPDYVALVTEAIRNVIIQYAEDIYSREYLKKANPEQLQSVLCSINPQLLLECLLLEIRGKTISYCAWKKKNKQAGAELCQAQSSLS